MYQDYFSLERHPFRITPDTSLFYSGGDQGRGVVLDAMLYAIASGEGILKVVGEVGSGKTMLCRMLEEQLPESTEVVYIANPNLSPEDILYAIAFELKLPVRRDTSKLLVMQQLQNYLLKQHAANRKVLVIIEEAQGMPVETLEEIRLFSNLETHRDKLMQIILFGQPELDKNLSVKHIRQLRERITHSFHLTPLSVEQTSEYIRFRLGAAGCPCPKLFTRQAEWLIAKASGGLTRRVNILADKSLLAAFSENVLNLPEKLGPDVPPVITAKHVYAAIRDSDYSLSLLDRLLSPLRIAGASLFAITVLVTFVLWPRTSGIASPMPASNDYQGRQTNELELVLADSPKPEQYAATPNPMPAVLTASAFPTELALIMPSIESLDILEAQESDLPKPGASGSGLEQNTVTESLDTDIQAEIASFATSSIYLQPRSIATLDWLSGVDREGYTIQFLSGEMSNLDFAESFLGILAGAGLVDDSYVCISKVSDRAYWTIKHGSFSGLSIATRYIDQLPEQLNDFKPFVQNINGVECNSNDIVATLMPE